MAVKRLGIIMNGVTGRMGTNQHLVRSIVAIRREGGVALALTRVHVAIERLQRWSPPDSPLIDRVRDEFHRAACDRPARILPQSPRLVDAVYRAIPTDIRPPRFPDAVRTTDAAARRFVAAHAFASWTAHLGDGLHLWVRAIGAAAALLEAGAGVRHADLLLRHLADPGRIAVGDPVYLA